MARPINADANATRARIQSHAVRLFSQRGMGATSSREIARASNVSLAMVNHYFGSKQGLYDACVEAMYMELGAARKRILGALAAGTTPEEILSRAIRECFRLARERREAVRLILRKMLDDGGLDPRRRDEELLPFLEEASQIFAGVAGRAPESLRLPLQSLVFLVVRHAIHTEEELQLITGEKSTALSAVEDHLVDTGRRLLLLPVETVPP